VLSFSMITTRSGVLSFSVIVHSLVRRARATIVRLLDGWPTATVLLGAYQRIALLT
jgi:hypothetical protein